LSSKLTGAFLMEVVLRFHKLSFAAEMKTLNNFNYICDMKNLLIVLTVILVCFSCENESKPTKPALIGNPAAAGFRAELSDAKAIALADEVMEAMGGRMAYDTTRFVGWNFFGSRTLLWDKFENQVRIKGHKDTFDLILNMNDMTGECIHKGTKLVEADTLNTMLNRGKEIWINDSYWLVMPFKLKDSGVALKYERADTLPGGKDAEVLSLTFENVGVTPENKYEVWVDSIPRFVTPWVNYQKYGDLLLSDDRGNYKLTDIFVSNDPKFETEFEGL